MADAPAAGGGGGGWGALEVILAIILAIGLISTLTGNPIVSVTGPAKKAAITTKSKTTVSATDSSGCGIIMQLPTPKQSIDTVVTVKGIVARCINTTSIPSTLTAYVIDSKNTILSAYTTIAVNQSYFGDPTFSAVIPLQGVAHSTTAYVIINGPTRMDGSMLSSRVQVQLRTGTATTTTTTTNTGSYFVPTNGNPAQVYTSPTTTTTNNNTNTGGSGNTF